MVFASILHQHAACTSDCDGSEATNLHFSPCVLATCVFTTSCLALLWLPAALCQLLQDFILCCSGAFGSGTARYLRHDESNLPPGHSLHTVTVHYQGGRQQLVTYKQLFDDQQRRLCLHCNKPVPDCVVPPDAVLEGGIDLFCSLDCERLFYIKNSSGEETICTLMLQS